MHDVHITGPLPPTQHNHKGLALCPRCHPAWASEGTPVGPGKDIHGTLRPEQRGGRRWPTPTPKRRSAHAMTRTQDSPTHKSSAKRGNGASDHQLQVTITTRRVRATIPVTQQERNVRAAECSCNRAHRFRWARSSRMKMLRK